ncbi:MAG: hypothetical protein K0R36_2536 [Chryseobacterium sp.]|jgi:hypothetical protein|nr:hypothetical protein [Chryseobacterium sp.]
MKNILFLLFFVISCKSYTQQTIVPLRTYTDIPENAGYYIKDTNNELQAFEGTWNGKTIFITFKKMINKYNTTMKYNEDIIIGKFKTLDSNGNVLFDNLALPDDQAKIRGGNFQNITNKYLMSYRDNDICGIGGSIYLTFANPAKTQLNFSYDQTSMVLTSDCYFHGWAQADRPEPLPKDNIVLTKQ